jgi:hypothetical protein
MENLIDRTLKHIKARREKVLKGGVNCIPSPFKRFRKDFVGIEQKKYYLYMKITIKRINLITYKPVYLNYKMKNLKRMNLVIY